MALPSPPQRFIIPDLPTADELLPFLRKIDEERWYSNFGPLANGFEAGFTKLMATAHGESKQRPCAAMATGYHALITGLRLMGIGPGSRVLVPDVTFPACPLAVQNLGAEAILADIDPISWTLTPSIARAIVQHTKIDAVMPVAIYGMPLPAKAWDEFIDETGIPVIIDAAAAVESQRYPNKAFVAHSLHALKPFGIGEGGILMAPTEELAAQARTAINFGTRDRITYSGGENGKMSEYHAAVGLAQIQRWPQIKARRRQVYEAYRDALAPFGQAAALHPGLEESVVSNLMISINCDLLQVIYQEMYSARIAVHRTYLPPLHTHPHFSGLTLANSEGKTLLSGDFETKNRFLAGTKRVNDSILGLPFHAFMSDEEIHHSVKILGEALGIERDTHEGAQPCAV